MREHVLWVLNIIWKSEKPPQGGDVKHGENYPGKESEQGEEAREVVQAKYH